MNKMLTSLARRARDLQIPTNTTIELLARCNLQCRHCYVVHDVESELTQEIVEDLLAQLHALGTFQVNLTGGEIGLRSDLFDIIAAARRRWFSVHLLSNGTLWQAPEWDRIADLGVSGVQVTLFSTSCEIHDAVTGVAGSHGKTSATLRGLLDRGVEVAISTPVLAANVDEVAGVIELAHDLGISISLDPNLQSTHTGDPTPKACIAPLDRLLRLYSDQHYLEWVDRVSRNPCLVPGQPASEPGARPCAAGESSTFIRCSGDLYPCLAWPQSAGNIIEQRYVDIWHQGAELERARAVVNETLTTCQACGDRAFCRPCAAMNLQDTGSMAAASPTFCHTTAARSIAQRGFSDQPTKGASPFLSNK